MTAGVLVVDAEVGGRPGMRVRVRDGRIVAVAPSIAPAPGDAVLDARGGAVLPGLHDHHIHLRSLVAARSSVAVDPASVRDRGGLAGALRRAATGLAPGTWLRAVGAYGPEFAAWDRYALDRCVPDRPARVQHRGGALWLLNSRAIEQLGVRDWPDEGVERAGDGTPTGRLWRLDHRVRAADTAVASAHADGLAAVGREALRLGIVGFTDATPGRSAADFAALAGEVARGRIRQRLVLMTEAAPPVPPHSRVTAGPRKIVLDDDTLPDVEVLAKTIAATHGNGAPVAIHAVTAEQLVVATAALDAAGATPGDRVEHASVVPPGFAGTLAALGVCVVSQPGFLWQRGEDYLRDVPGAERDWLYPFASLLAAGVSVAASSDAPFGPLDPWVGVRAAATRRTASGAVLGAAQRCPAATALAMYLGRPDAPGIRRRVAAGQPGDLCVLRVPLAQALRDPAAHQVAAVVLDGEVSTWAS